MVIVRGRWGKVGLTVVVVIIAGILAQVLRPLPGVGPIVQSLALLVGFLWLTRVFRGAGEPDAPRPLWRMTATPAWSYGLATLWLVGAFLGVVLLVVGPIAGSAAMLERRTGDVAALPIVGLVIEVLCQIVLLVLFVRSGRRLRALEEAEASGPGGAGPRLPS